MKLFSVAITQHGQQFHAQVPDLPTINIIGHSIADTIDKVRSAIIIHLHQLASNHEPLPEPEHITTHLNNPRFAGHTWAMISLDSMIFENQQRNFTLNIPCALATRLQSHLGQDKRDIEQFIITAIANELERSNTTT